MCGCGAPRQISRCRDNSSTWGRAGHARTRPRAKTGGADAPCVRTVPGVTYLSPLGYLLGLEGAALLRGFRERSADQAFVEARIAEIRRLLETPELADAEGVTAVPGAISTADVYQDWAPPYDDPGNQMIDIEQPVVRRILDGLPVGAALDAACGTGRRHRPPAPARPSRDRRRRLAGDARAGTGAAAGRRSARGRPASTAASRRRGRHRRLRARVDPRPRSGGRTGRVRACAAARRASRDLGRARHVVLLPAHPPRRPGPDGRATLLTEYHRPLSAYLSAALPLGFQVRHCEEPRRPRHSLDPGAAPDPLPTWMSWDLLHWDPEASAAALDESPVVVIWHFQLGDSGEE